MANTYTQTGTYSSYSISASGDIVELQFASGASDIGLVLGGTFSATIQFEVGLANLTTGVTWTALTCNPVPSGSGVTSSTAAGTWSAVVAGFTHFRFRASAFASGRCYATVNATLAADGGGIITSGAAHDTAVFASATSIKGVDPGTSGQVLTSNGASTDPSYQDAGTTDLSAYTTTAGISLTDNSASGVVIQENGAGGIALNSPNGSVALSGGQTVDIQSAVSSMDFDDTVSGVITASTIINAVGGYQANGTPGISGTGTTMTGVTVVNGIITAATFA